MKQECSISKHLSYHHEMSIPRGQRQIVQPTASVCPEGRENSLATELCAALT